MRHPHRLAFVAFAMTLCALAACPYGHHDQCAPNTTRCSPAGEPQACSPAQDWAAMPIARQCAAQGGVCCRAMSPYGHVVHACVASASACLPDPAPDAGLGGDATPAGPDTAGADGASSR